jgi:uncharacterized protein (DUF1810 family)
MEDPFDLGRFVAAQDRVWDAVLEELRRGAKRSHWMWFVFPQIAGLGSSPAAQHYAISGREEAEAYLRHPVLGPRLGETTAIMNGLPGDDALQVLGRPDDLKFRSSMTLFSRVAGADPGFARALEKYFGGEPCEGTLATLGEA